LLLEVPGSRFQVPSQDNGAALSRHPIDDYTDEYLGIGFNLEPETWNLEQLLRLGIRYRLLVPLALLLVGVVGASLWSARVAARRAKERVAAQVRDVSQTLNGANYPLTPNVLEQMKSLSGAEFLLIQPDGSRVSTFSAGPVDVPSEESLVDSVDAGIGPVVRAAGVEYRCRRLALKRPNENAGAVVYIFYPESLLNEAIADAERPSLLGLLFGLVAVGLTFGIGQRLVARIRALERRTRQIAAGDFSPMPLPRANDELRDLTASVNEMADRLARLQQTVQTTERMRLTGQLATGLAHQLRNSVTGATLAVQVYLADHADNDTEALTVTLRQLAVMEANLRRFIDLGRSDAGPRKPCNIVAILTEVVELHRPRCKHAGIELRWDKHSDEAIVEGDPGQLADLFVNIVGNAVDAVGTDGHVTLSLQRADGRIAVEISDTGPGPPADLASRLFEPFVSGKPEGIGLGLAVARHASIAQGGDITWRREAGRTVFRVELPSA
jgi:signal transduction histidine kinase